MDWSPCDSQHLVIKYTTTIAFVSKILIFVNMFTYLHLNNEISLPPLNNAFHYSMIELALVYWLNSIHLNIYLEDERIDHDGVNLKNKSCHDF